MLPHYLLSYFFIFFFNVHIFKRTVDTQQLVSFHNSSVSFLVKIVICKRNVYRTLSAITTFIKQNKKKLEGENLFPFFWDNPHPSISDDKNQIRAVITMLSRFFWISDQFVVSDIFENIHVYRE